MQNFTKYGHKINTDSFSSLSFSEKEIENIINTMLFHWTHYPLRTLIKNDEQ
jgi:hypothetical protein